GIGFRKPSVPVSCPLHGRPNTIAITEMDVVPHSDLIAVIHDGTSRECKNKTVEQFDLSTIIIQQWSESAGDPNVAPHLWIARVSIVHVIPFFAGTHFQRQFVMVPEKQAPLAILRNRRCVREHVHDRMPILTTNPHEQPRHEGKMERHVELIAITEVRTYIRRPLVGFRHYNAPPIGCVDPFSYFCKKGVGFWKVLTDCALSLKEIGHRVATESIEALLQPEDHDIQHGLLKLGIIVVQIWLMAEKPMPVISLSDRIPGPVGLLCVDKDNARFLISLVGLAPDIEVALC